MCVAMIHEYPIAFARKAYLSSAFVVALFTYTHTNTLRSDSECDSHVKDDFWR